MNLWNKPATRLLCAELLERRWLLSVAGPAGANGDGALTTMGGRVELIEREAASEDDEDDEVETSELPAEVLAALNQRFPGAQILEAEAEEEDRTEYGVNALFNGRTLDVSLAPDGTILEIEETVSSDALPQAVRDYVKENYPGAQIDEAVSLTGAADPTFELHITPANGSPVEEKVRLVQTSPPSSDGEVSTGDGLAVVPPTVSGSVFSVEAEAPTETDLLDTSALVDQAPAKQSDVANPVAQSERLKEADSTKRDDADAASIWTGEFAPVSQALQALAAGTGASVWRPRASGLLNDAVPVNVAAIELAMKRILHEIDKVAEKALAQTSLQGTGAVPFVAIAGLFATAQLVLLSRRVPKGGPMVVFNGDKTSWSWVLGAATPADRP